jgi:hypothetical protein
MERSDGVPLFVEEVTKAVLEAGNQIAPGQITTKVPTSRFVVPATSQASLIARLDRLGAAKEVCCQYRLEYDREQLPDVNHLLRRRSDVRLSQLVSQVVRAIIYLRRTASQAGTPLLADRADDAAFRPRVIRGQLVLA